MDFLLFLANKVGTIDSVNLVKVNIPANETIETDNDNGFIAQKIVCENVPSASISFSGDFPTIQIRPEDFTFEAGKWVFCIPIVSRSKKVVIENSQNNEITIFYYSITYA